MNKQQTRFIGVAMPVLAAAFLALPVLAQDAAPAPQTATPPVAVPPATPSVAPPPLTIPLAVPAIPQDEGVTAAARRPAADAQSTTPVNPDAAAQAAAEDAERRTARHPTPLRAPPAATQRQTVPVRTRSVPTAPPVAAAATPSPTPTPTPTAETSPVPGNATGIVDATNNGTATSQAATTSTTRNRRPLWPWVLAGLAVLAVLAGLIVRRRRAGEDDENDAEPVYVEPEGADVAAPMVEQPVATPAPVPIEPAPIMADPATVTATPAEDATVSVADEGEVAALTAGAPVDDRPWLEFALRPVRAGLSADEGQVEIELTVGNAGTVAAADVRIATYLIEHGNDAAIAALLANPPAADGEPATIAAGEGLRVEAVLALPRATLTGAFQPVVVADARYRLADGSEGRTSAAFEIGLTGAKGGFEPVAVDQSGMRDDVEARLIGEPRRA